MHNDDLRSRVDEIMIRIASRGEKQHNNSFLPPRLWAALRQSLQEFYRRATGEHDAVLDVVLAPAVLPVETTQDATEALKAALAPLVAIADAYDDNALDDEARKYWGTVEHPRTNTGPTDQIELYTGRGGKRLLTLEQCLAARRVVRGEPLQPPAPPVDRVRLTKPVGLHFVGAILKIVQVIPHNSGDAVQYLADDGTYIPSERAEVYPDE